MSNLAFSASDYSVTNYGLMGTEGYEVVMYIHIVRNNTFFLFLEKKSIDCLQFSGSHSHTSHNNRSF